MIWAAIDVLNGECVQLTGGDPTTARFNRDPVEAAMHWASAGASGLHIVDLDKALGQGSNAELVGKILNVSPIPTQIDGGIRSTAEIEGWLETGASRVIVGTKAIQNRKWLEEITNAFPERIVLALDTKQAVITTDG